MQNLADLSRNESCFLIYLNQIPGYKKVTTQRFLFFLYFFYFLPLPHFTFAVANLIALYLIVACVSAPSFAVRLSVCLIAVRSLSS